ncbi:hypothetical protein ACI797_26145 [Geodermatophilus sp. SYSU D00691]
MTATTALRDVHHYVARAELRRALTRKVLEEGPDQLPDWSSFRVIGPFEVFDPRGAIRFEYRGSVGFRALPERLPNKRVPR